jgi:hypothetical protein
MLYFQHVDFVSPSDLEFAEEVAARKANPHFVAKTDWCVVLCCVALVGLILFKVCDLAFGFEGVSPQLRMV